MTIRTMLFAVLSLSLCLGCQPADTTTTTSAPEAAPAATDAPVAVSNFYEITTPQGRMVIRLYDETPGHRDNFAKLVAEEFFDGTTFHRVIDQFMIQGGDPNSKDDNLDNDGQGGPGYTIPAEFDSTLFHKRGALSAARQGDMFNPERESSGSQFYIVEGRPLTEEELTMREQQVKEALNDPTFTFSEEAKQVYMTEGGTPFLDMQYTVFGELVEGFDVLDAISAVPVQGRGSRPLTDVPMTIRALENYTPPSSEAGN
ncbi:MAG: peptidylprolyl isomerase [Bacteroidota bacterium]